MYLFNQTRSKLLPSIIHEKILQEMLKKYLCRHDEYLK